MELIKWHDHFSVSSELIDNQHKKLIQLINRLYTAFKKKSVNDELQNIIAELKAYTIYHFSVEEKLFKEHNYPFKDDHEMEHQLFIDKIADFEEKFKQNKATLTFEMMTFLRQWLTHHILETDMQYVPYLFSK